MRVRGSNRGKGETKLRNLVREKRSKRIGKTRRF